MSWKKNVLLQSNKKKERVDDTKLPGSIGIPNVALQKLFGEPMNLEKGTTFIVEEVIGDGNCLYRSLSQSQILKNMYPHVANDHMAVRKMIHEFTGLHPTLCKEIFSEYNSVSSEKLHGEFCKWRETIRDGTKWGGAAEMTVFAYCYGIHCMLVSQWFPRVVTTYTYGIERLKRFRMTNHDITSFEDKPKNPSDVIFIWHHNISRPTNYVGKKNGPDDMKYYNHFSLLVPIDKSDINPEVVFVHEDNEEDATNVDSDFDNTKGQSETTLKEGTASAVPPCEKQVAPTGVHQKELSNEMEKADDDQDLPEAKRDPISLPDQLHVSNQLFHEFFLHEIDREKTTAFAVNIVEEDGHSLFRSLSQSQILRSRYPDLSGNYLGIRKLLYEYALEKNNIGMFVMGISREKVKPSDKLYMDRVNQLLHEKHVGEGNEIALFSLQFGIHGLYLRDHNNTAQVFSSYDDVKKVHSNIQLGKRNKIPENAVRHMPKNLSETIVLWQHTPTGCFCRHKGCSVDENWKHYTLMEPLSDDHHISPYSLILTPDHVEIKQSEHEKNSSDKEDKMDDSWDQDFDEIGKTEKQKYQEEKMDDSWDQDFDEIGKTEKHKYQDFDDI
jgi:hypothetical protein